jgi:hypothetical protein
VHKEDTMLKSGMTVAMTQEFEQKFKMILEAGAFRSLLEHLADRSDIVQNIDLMNISGFCRNCLAKVRYDYHLVLPLSYMHASEISGFLNLI